MDGFVLDALVFVAFVAAVLTVGIVMSRDEGDSESYFLAGRGLGWWLIGFSLIAANISTEQFVGMSGQAADYVGLAIASYEWMAAITLVVVAFVFLPKFLSTGIYTIPEFLRYRYDEASRVIMAAFTMIIYVGVTIAAVIYSGALTLDTLFRGESILGVPVNVVTGSWTIGIIAAIYVAAGGLKACAWADLLQGSALIVGGAIITVLAFMALGATPLADLTTTAPVPQTITDASSGVDKFLALNGDKLHMVLPMTDPVLPWTALLVGLWIPNFYYWGLNQYITQRMLGSASLAEGQRGIVFAAALKLVIPFVIVFPGIAAFNLYGKEMRAEAQNDPQIAASWRRFEEERARPVAAPYAVYELDAASRSTDPARAREVDRRNAEVREASARTKAPVEVIPLASYKYDSAFGLLIGRLLPHGTGLRGFVLAAILGAVVSSLASMLNSASTIFTMDLYRKFVDPNAPQRKLVLVGRVAVGVFVVIGCFVSPLLADPSFKGVFTYIQEFQGFISPGILAVFVFGLVVRRAPPVCGVVGLLANPAMYGLLKVALPDLAFLDRMALAFAGVLVVMGLITWWRPLSAPIALPVNTSIDLTPSRGARTWGIVVAIATAALYAFFW